MRILAVLVLVACACTALCVQAQQGSSGPAPAAQSSGSTTGALAAALARLRDTESATRLTAEGRALYQADSTKRSAYDYCSTAIALAERGDFRESIRAASKALFLGTTENNNDYIAHAKRDLALAYLYAGDLDNAQRYASEALKHDTRPNNRRAVHSVANKILGDVALKRSDFANAIRMYEEAISVADGSQRFFARAALASAYVAGTQPAKAKVALENADSNLSVLSALLQPGARQLLLRIRGALALKEGAYDDAIKLYESALPALSGSDGAYERFWVLEGLGRAKLAKGDREGALRSFLDAIEETEQIRVRFRSEEVKSGLFGEMQDVFGQAVALLIGLGQADQAWEVSERGRARALLDLMRNRVRLTQGGVVSGDAFSKPTRIQDLVSRLKPGEVVIGYHVLAGNTYGWAIRSSGATALTLDIGRAALAQQVQDYRDAVVQRQGTAAQHGAKLHDMLVKPFALGDGEAVTFIPHDALHYLPFQSLPAGDKYLIDRVAVSYAPSGGALLALADRQPPSTGRFFALGNPDLGDPKMALPGAQREVEALKAMFADSEVYFQKEATRERLMLGASQARLVHVAAHGSVDPVDPLYSKLYLADTPAQPGTLEARDVYAMRFENTRLITLSACETGLGKVSRGDEIWGFTRSFLSAGAPALIVSLWPVADESTEILMKRFYAELSKGSSARAALRAAQLELTTDVRFSAPFFWAAFNLVGDSR